jgi:hypothetical protein
MNRIMQYGFTLLLIIAVAVALFVSRKWNATTALFPQAVGFPMLALLVVVLAMEIGKERRRRENRQTDGDRRFAAGSGLMVLYLTWLVGFIALAWAIGLLYSIPVYVLTYMKIQGKYSWLTSGIYAAGATIFVLLFGYAFQMGWPVGALLSIL